MAKRQLQLEPLESRRPLAVIWETGSPPPGFSASVVGDALQMMGSGRPDRVEVMDLRTRHTDPEVRIYGLLSDERYFEIRHQGDQLIRGWVLQADVQRYLVYFGKGGDDFFRYVDTSRDVNPLKPLRIIAYGGDGHDNLAGHELDDLLFGDEGDDTLIGGWGADLLMGGPGGDRLIGDGVARQVPDDTMTDADYLIGGVGVDDLRGDQGADWLNGADFWNTIDEARDQVLGYANADCFYLESLNEPNDYSIFQHDRRYVAGMDSGTQSLDYHDWLGVRLPSIDGRPLNTDAYAHERAALNNDTIRASWPNLWQNNGQGFEILGPSTLLFDENQEPIVRYNCAAYSVGVYDQCSTRIETLSEAHSYLTAHGFRPHALNVSVDARLEKIAVYAISDAAFPDSLRVTHFARQLQDGSWVSKFGPGPLMRHRNLEVLAGNTGQNSYGTAARIYVRDRLPVACSGNPRVAQVGDVNSNERFDVGDLNQLTQAVLASTAEPWFDIEGNGQVNRDDVTRWLELAGNTNVGRPFSFGDANLDGVFDSGDLVEVFAYGTYEDALSANATWSSGDWDGDGEFGTSDLILALATGTYRT